MSELIFVTTENCELCKKAENKIKFIKPFYQIREVDVQEDHKEFLFSKFPLLMFVKENNGFHMVKLKFPIAAPSSILFISMYP